MRFYKLNWDEVWDEIVQPFLQAEEEFDASLVDTPHREYAKALSRINREEWKYDKYYIESTECKLYAKTLIANLAEKHPNYQYAAHAGPHGYWRILVRSASGKAIQSKRLVELQDAATPVLRSVKQKHAWAGARSRAMSSIRSWAEERASGCLFSLIVIVLAIYAIIAIHSLI